jgi:hypothetical protein
MQDERRETLTQEGLVAELHKRGYIDVTVRRVADWRRNELLPPFDVAGGGRGQSRGREHSSWSGGTLVVEQAQWVCELLQLDRDFEALYLPLWLLGYPVPLTRVREALRRPLEEAVCGVEAEAASGGELEDIIGDAAYSYAKDVERTGAEVFQIPQDALEGFINILFNRGYDLTDAAFEFAVEAQREYERAHRERHAAALAAEGADPSYLSRQNDGFASFFTHAQFIKEYLSLHQLKRAVDECTDEDLRAVERDLGMLREMALMLHRMLTILARDLPEDFKDSMATILPAIFGVGRILIWADLSLRNKGLAEVIEYYLPEGLRLFREEFNEKLERELAESSRAIAEAMEISVKIITNGYSQEGHPVQ